MEKSPVVRCPRTNFRVDRSVGNDLWTEWAAVVPSMHTFEQVCSPAYFGAFRSTRLDSPRNSDNGLRVRDRINIVAEDGSWVAKLMVRDVRAGINEVHTRVMEHIDFGASDLPEGYTIKHRGARGWVIYLHGHEVEPGFSDPEQAENRIKYFVREKALDDKVDAIETAAKPKRAAKKKAEAEPEVAAEATAE